MDIDQEPILDDSKKPPVVRGARACTVCRTAKMKCVGADDGKRPCDRCKRQNLPCIFEKHRRGRKPGSKLSEASKMLRRLEKGLSTAKAKSHALESAHPYPSSSSAAADAGPSHRGPYASPGAFPNNELPPLKFPPPSTFGDSSADPRNNDPSDDEDELDASAAPATLINRENQRQPFLKTVLNNAEESPLLSCQRSSTATVGRPSPYPYAIQDPVPTPDIQDPISAGLIDEENAKVLFDLIFLRLNPFINLFDPALHSVFYVRSRSPFLFTTLLMAGCKFFKPEAFYQCRKMANELAVRAFAENWKSVEVVQAFACLCYWKDPEDTRTWTYIGYACRMAIELGLNRYHATPPPHETELQLRERRNRERTYLVLFVHDRSLATQTGRASMLPEDHLVQNAHVWHERGGDPVRPEDVIVSAFVQLRCITAETADVFRMQRGATEHGDLHRDALLRNCNGKLTQWMTFWESEMQRAGGERFHMEFLKFFRLYVRVFLNSFGLQGSMSNQTRAPPSVQALTMCYTSAIEHLQIVYEEFAKMNMLRYGQDSITMMTAYCAVFLLRLLRSSTTLANLNEGATEHIHSIISKTADAYEEAATCVSTCTGAAYHARFLRGLVAQDIFKARQTHGSNQSPASSSPSSSTFSRASTATYHNAMPQSSSSASPPYIPPPAMAYAPPQEPGMLAQAHPHSYGVPMHDATEAGGAQQQHNNGPFHPQGADLRYWDQMFRDLGFAGSVDATAASSTSVYPSAGPSTYGAAPGAYAYQYMQSDTVGYPA